MIDRKIAIELLAPFLNDQIVIASLGGNSHLLHMIAPRKLNCYMRGGMGMCTSYGLGIALAKPNKKVVCLDGDGSLLMNLGSLCTIGSLAPKNLVIIVYDNKEFYGEPTATAYKTEIAKVALDVGFKQAQKIVNIDNLSPAYANYLAHDGPSLLTIEIPLLNDRREFNIEQDVLFRNFRQFVAAEE